MGGAAGEQWRALAILNKDVDKGGDGQLSSWRAGDEGRVIAKRDSHRDERRRKGKKMSYEEKKAFIGAAMHIAAMDATPLSSGASSGAESGAESDQG